MTNIKAIDNFINDPIPSNMDCLIALGKSDKYSDDEIAYLSTKLAKSGQCVSLPDNIIAADIPSTGGPSSLTTLICPLVLRELGYWVPKLGVRGRPAGGIDVLYQIPGYKVNYTHEELMKCLEENGYCHFLAGKNHTPLDAILFKYRSQVNATAVFPLVIASILSKKIAAGLNLTGLDVRVSKYGNFGTTWAEAIDNSKRFIKVASKVGIHAICMLNNLNYLQQPYIGRGEALLALKKIFSQESSGLLKKHLEKCISMGLELKEVEQQVVSNIIFKLKEHFKNNLVAQGSSWSDFLNKTEEVENAHIYEFKAQETGFLNIDLYKLKQAIVWGQNKFNINGEQFSDPCGVIFKRMDNDMIINRDTILTIRSEPKLIPKLEEQVSLAISINRKIKNNIEYEVIT